jgi:tetratricopeptide (TPR) repeat protein
MTISRIRSLGLLLVLPLFLGGCSKLLAKQDFRDGNKAYKEENYKKARDLYQRAVERDPNFSEAYFYLGSCWQSMYRPGKETEENKQNLVKAVEAFQKAIEVNDGSTPNLKTVKQNALAALTGIYAEEPYRNFDEALKFAKQLVEENPNEAKNLFAMANLYEKFEHVVEAEEAYKKVVELNPNDAKGCAALAGFYNKPLWEGKSRFEDAISTLERCATLDAADPTGFYKVAVFYWDKAFRDPLLDDKQKDAYADKGLEAVDKALGIKPDYVDGLVYKGLLLRVKAQVTTNNRLRQQYLDQAQTLAKQAKELRIQQASEAAPPPVAAGT